MAVDKAMLRKAAMSAKQKAEILCEAAEAEACASYGAVPRSIDIEPDDIDVSDTAAFVWKIK